MTTATRRTPMTDEDLWYFTHNGFYKVPELLPDDLIDRLNAATDRQIQIGEPPIVRENRDEPITPGNIRRISKILDRDPVYLEAAQHPIILDALENILGPNIELVTNKHNHMMIRPGRSYPVPWHSGESPYSYLLVTASIFLEESNLENGCIRIVPGSHQRPFRYQGREDPEERRPKGEFREVELYRRSLPVPMPRGGVLLFIDRCYHGSDINETDSSRRALTLAYRPHDVKNVIKHDPEKILVRGERAYSGHTSPYEGYTIAPLSE